MEETIDIDNEASDIQKTNMIWENEKIHKEEKEYIYNESNYFNCSYDDCNMLIYVNHIQKHLLDHIHKSRSVKKLTEIHNDKFSKIFLCSECGEEFMCFESIASHIFSHVGEHNLNGTEKNNIKGNIFNENNYITCSFKDCNLVIYIDHLKIHLQDHEHKSRNEKKLVKENYHESKKILCSECGQDFLCFKTAASHIFSHFREMNLKVIESKNIEESIFNENNYLSCSFKNCNLVIYIDHIKKHLQDHEFSSERKFKKEPKYDQKSNRIFLCSECGEKFMEFKTAANHIFSHFNAKYYCDRCDYKSFNKRNVSMHYQRIHMNQTRVQCKSCNNVYKHHLSLREHMRRMHVHNPENVKTNTFNM